MSTNWLIPTGANLPAVISLQAIRKTNENTDQDSQDAFFASNPPRDDSTIPFDSTLENRANDLVQIVVSQVREAIQVAGRNPLSVTPNAVPPLAYRHVLNIAAFQLVSSTPSLIMVLMTDKGAYSPLQTFYKEGLAYIQKLTEGAGVVPPIDPTGADYLTAVSDSNPSPWAVMSAEIVGEIDLSTDGPEGYEIFYGTALPNGNQIGSPGDQYQQIINGRPSKIWQKITGECTNVGWI